MNAEVAGKTSKVGKVLVGVGLALGALGFGAKEYYDHQAAKVEADAVVLTAQGGGAEYQHVYAAELRKTADWAEVEMDFGGAAIVLGAMAWAGAAVATRGEAE